jgi:hypothetical protein
MKRILSTLTATAALTLAASSQAALLDTTSVTSTGSYNGNLSLLTDGIIPNEGSYWQSNTVWWNGTLTSFSFDLGDVFSVEDLRLSLDNNDTYAISYSMDGINWESLIDISNAFGEIGWGVDTFSTDSANSEYIASIDFSAVEAQYLSISAISGDNSYSIGEFEVYGSAISTAQPGSGTVPLPGTLALMGLGLAALRLARKK